MKRLATLIAVCLIAAFAAQAMAAAAPASVGTRTTALGTFLVAGGRTLYLFEADSRNQSSCTGPCAGKTRSEDDRSTGSGTATGRAKRRGNVGGWTVCRRRLRKSPLSDRYGRVGQPFIEGLSLRGNEELRDHEARRLHVREGSNRR